jgi:hypothetical protein
MESTFCSVRNWLPETRRLIARFAMKQGRASRRDQEQGAAAPI